MDPLDKDKLSENFKSQLKQSADFDEVYKQYGQVIFQKCLHFGLSQHDAKDALQDILIKLYNKLPTFEGGSNLSTWIHSVVANHCVDIVRKRKKQQHIIAYDSNLHEDVLDEIEENIDIRFEKLEQVIALLSDEEKQLLNLRYNKGYSLKKVGELMVLKDSTIKMKLLRLKQKIAKKINPTVNLKGE